MLAAVNSRQEDIHTRGRDTQRVTLSPVETPVYSSFTVRLWRQGLKDGDMWSAATLSCTDNGGKVIVFRRRPSFKATGIVTSIS